MSKHLTLEQRYEIQALLNAKHKKKFIAKQIGKDKSVITRELQRNSNKRGYNAMQAHQFTRERSTGALKKKKFNNTMEKIIKEKLLQDWSPEEIIGHSKMNHVDMVSHERIYQYIYQDKEQGGNLFLHLRTSRPKRKKRSKHKYKSYGIPNRVFIDQRPDVVNNKERFGDWEGDTIVGAYNKGAILTLVERKSMFAVAVKTNGKKADSIRKQMINGLAPYKQFVHTITTDNGTEFAEHQAIAEKLDMGFFFAHPYSSWERGLNEYTNKLLRQYIPKKTSFDNYDQTYINDSIFKLNNRPRKKLSYKTPQQVFLANFVLPKVAFIT